MTKFYNITTGEEFNNFADVQKAYPTIARAVFYNHVGGRKKDIEGNVFIRCAPSTYLKGKIICIDTGEEFDSLEEVSKYCGSAISNISAHLKGRLRKVKGLMFRRIE